MAATVLLNAVSLPAGTSSTPSTFTITGVAREVSFVLSASSASTVRGLSLIAQVSLDGTLFADPQVCGTVNPGGKTFGKVDVWGAAAVKFTVKNNADNAPITATLQVAQF